MEVLEEIGIELELKYCERCGGLWFRRTGQDGVYCESCAPQMAEMRLVRNRRTVRLPKGVPPKSAGRGGLDLEGRAL